MLWFKKKELIDDNRISLFELYKALLFLVEKQPCSAFSLSESSHKYSTRFSYDFFHFKFFNNVSCYHKYCDFRADIFLINYPKYERIGRISSHSKYNDSDTKIIEKDKGLMVLTDDSPFTEEELNGYFKKIIDEYRIEYKKYKDKEQKQYDKEMEMRTKNRQALFESVIKHKHEILNK